MNGDAELLMTQPLEVTGRPTRVQDLRVARILGWINAGHRIVGILDGYLLRFVQDYILQALHGDVRRAEERHIELTRAWGSWWL